MLETSSLFILPALTTSYLFSNSITQDLNISAKNNFVDFLLVGILILIFIPFINFITDWNSQLILPKGFEGLMQWMKTTEANAYTLTQKLLNVHSTTEYLLNIIAIGIFPAFGEELYFRGVIQNSILKSKNSIVAVWITAFIFSAIHFQFFGFAARFLVGGILGLLYLWSKNIWIPIFAHCINNTCTVSFYFLKYKGIHIIDFETIGIGDTWWIALLSLCIGIILTFIIRHRLKTD
jgi:membrane protease YdiL (CAAX protease family)